MKLWVVAVGQRTPDWAQVAWDDYAKRFPPEWKLGLKAVKAEPRGSKPAVALMAAEADRLRAAIRSPPWRCHNACCTGNPNRRKWHC